MKTRLSLITLLLICSTLFFSGQAFTQTERGQTKRGLLPTDLAAIKEVSDAQISPDGSRVVYVVGEVAPDRSRTISRLWIVPTAGGAPKLLTKGDASEAFSPSGNESGPRWSPDGKWIAFYSSRDKKDGLWIVSADGGEPKLATYVVRTNFFLNKAGESFSWSPDSKQIAFLSSPEVLSQSAPTENTTALQQAGIPAQVLRPLSREEIEKLPVEVREMIFRAQGQAMGVRPTSPVESALSALPEDPRVITRLQYKSRTAFSDNLQSHIFTVDLATKQLRQITTGLYYEHSINWSPKGDEIVFVSNHEPDPDRVNNSDLFTVNVNNFAIRQLTKTKGCEWQPVFSPDGSEIAYLATKREVTTIDSVAEDSHAYVVSAQGTNAIELAQGLDMRVSTVKWWRDGRRVVTAAANKGYTVLFLMDKSKADVLLERAIGIDSQVTSFSISSKPEIVYTANEVSHPPEVYIQRVEPMSQARLLSKTNDSFRATLNFSPMNEFRFKNDGFEAESWLIAPFNLDEHKKYPVILSIHGGPHGMHGYSFNANAQALAAQGYAVLLINPRGSSGYGQKFADGCINDWGGGDYRDLMKGVDVALEKFPFLDKDRMGVMGGSYGGYMTNWIVTQTDRFKAAVTSASLSNLISFYSTSLYQDLIHAEFSGPAGNMPWDNFDLLWERSPLKHIKKAKTPLLLLHGEQDNDVHITQAEEMYTALRMRGVDSVLVRYPREGHGFREPRHREDSLARTIQWFDRYLKK
jgi:dipeptidyl aminopeptidase/acylaminoacyl peptidase